jgi:hypothetical protein
MKKSLVFNCFLAFLFFSDTLFAQNFTSLINAPLLICDKTIDDFENSSLESFPESWQPKYEKQWPLIKSKKLWNVENDLSKKQNVLNAHFEKETVTIVKTTPQWDLEKYPVLEWEWKAVVLPKDGDEFDSRKNDSAASVYIAWKTGGFIPAKFVRLAWSTTRKIGETDKKFMGHNNILIMESGTEHLNQWMKMRISAKELNDYFIKYNGSKANPYAIALTTDADQTHSQAQAYYDNFKLCRWKTDVDQQSSFFERTLKFRKYF